MVPWLFLAVSIWGGLFTANALHPLRRPWVLSIVGFFPAWLTTELALHHLLWQAVATGGFIAFGALDAVAGWIGLAITSLSWLGLVWLFRNAYRDAAIVTLALDEGLGDGFRDEIIADHSQHLSPSIAWGRVLWPFRVGHPEVERIRDLNYGQDDNPRHRLDLFRRRNLEPGAPVLLQIHGGGWIVGNKEQQGLPLLYHMAARGWLCVSINYRLSPKATWPDHLVDCKRALRWVREHIAEHGGDPDVVIATGGSAGGHLTAMLALTANQARFQPGFEEVDTSLAGFIPFYGIFDWTDRFGYRGKNDPLLDQLERHIVKRSRAGSRDLYQDASPLSHITADAPPAMVLHGSNDTLAPVAEARKFVDLLRAESRAQVVYAELVGAHHAFEVFASVRALHAINGVEAFAAWVASRHQRSHS
jgi:acetyl esterase/lipase